MLISTNCIIHVKDIEDLFHDQSLVDILITQNDQTKLDPWSITTVKMMDILNGDISSTTPSIVTDTKEPLTNWKDMNEITTTLSQPSSKIFSYKDMLMKKQTKSNTTLPPPPPPTPQQLSAPKRKWEPKVEVTIMKASKSTGVSAITEGVDDDFAGKIPFSFFGTCLIYCIYRFLLGNML